MFDIKPSGKALGAHVHGLNLSRPLDDATVGAIAQALGRHGVLCFPNQDLSPEAHKAFAGRFGGLEVNVAGAYQVAGLPEVMTLSNIVRDGKPVGLADAGQGWHTDMSYSAVISFTNVLFALKVPRAADGTPLGDTEFANLQAAYDDLPQDLKTRLAGATAEHDFNKFWEMMRRQPGCVRPPLTTEQRRRKPPVHHPVFLRHPVTGRRVLYCNPGYATRIDGLEPAESDEILEFLFAHQLQEKYRYAHAWSEGDVLMWDNIGTIHNAVADYGPEQHRHMRRCQVMADKVFEGAFPIAV